MPDGEGGAAGGEQGSQQQPPEGQNGAGSGAGENEPFDQERAMRTIQALRDEVRAEKAKGSGLASKVQEYEQRDLTAEQRAQAEIDRLKAENEAFQQKERQAQLRNAFVSEAEKAGAKRVDLLFKAADGLELDESGKLKNAAALMRELRTQYPELFEPTRGGDGGRGREGNGSGGVDMDAMIRAAAGR